MILSSCNKEIAPETPDKLFEKYSDNVLLIANQYYYEINLDGALLYYSPSSEKKIFSSKEEVIENLSFSTGTGFMISSNGEILTNRHVANPTDENYKEELNRLRNIKRDLLSYKIERFNDTITRLKNYYVENSSYMEELEKDNINNLYTQLNDTVTKLMYDDKIFASFDIQNSTSKLVIYKLSVAFNDTHVTELDDLQECVIIKVSDKENVDLALIQTKTKKFNNPPKFLLNFNDNNPNIFENPNKFKERDIKKPIKINDDVYMIGYNKGFNLANTSQGIKSQFTSGKISQEYDGERILYTIPTLEGSSGSPIIDKWGNLIGVNFAKISNSQGFSFGIPVYEVKKFYEE
jgi:S1-C subfamily serine protease